MVIKISGEKNYTQGNFSSLFYIGLAQGALRGQLYGRSTAFLLQKASGSTVC